MNQEARSRRRLLRSGLRVASLILSFVLVWLFFFAVGDVLSRARDSSHTEMMESF